MTRHVLVPVDASERSREALDYALDEYADERLTVFHVVDPYTFYVAAGIEGGVMVPGADLQETFERQAEELLETMVEVATERGVAVDTAYEVGTVANAIVRYAEEHDVDHIVMGSHGRSGASRVLLGSVAERVTRRAPVSVTIVR